MPRKGAYSADSQQTRLQIVHPTSAIPSHIVRLEAGDGLCLGPYTTLPPEGRWVLSISPASPSAA